MWTNVGKNYRMEHLCRHNRYKWNRKFLVIFNMVIIV